MKRFTELLTAAKKRFSSKPREEREGGYGFKPQIRASKTPARASLKKFFANAGKKLGKLSHYDFKGVGGLGLDGGRIKRTPKTFIEVLHAQSIPHGNGPIWIQKHVEITGDNELGKKVFVAGHGVEPVQTNDLGLRSVRVKPIPGKDREEIRALVARRTKIHPSQVEFFLEKKSREYAPEAFYGAFDWGLEGTGKMRANSLQSFFSPVETIAQEGKNLVGQEVLHPRVGISELWVAGLSHSNLPFNDERGKKFFLLTPIRGRALTQQVRNAVLEHINAKKATGLLPPDAKIAIRIS